MRACPPRANWTCALAKGGTRAETKRTTTRTRDVEVGRRPVMSGALGRWRGLATLPRPPRFQVVRRGKAGGERGSLPSKHYGHPEGWPLVPTRRRSLSLQERDSNLPCLLADAH